MDTAGWIACADGSDPFHEEAIAARDAWMESGGVLITTDYVADETLTLLRRRIGLNTAKEWWNLLDSSPRIRWESIDTERADKARELFFRYRDKAFSFTDCTSFVVMREFKLWEALTTDHHFAQAGYTMHP